MWFATYLWRKGLISAEQFVEAADLHVRSRVLLGRIAMDLGKLSVKQVMDVLYVQADRQLPFGQLAVELGFITEQDQAYLLMVQRDRARPIEEILVELGAITKEAVESEIRQARLEAAYLLDEAESVTPSLP